MSQSRKQMWMVVLAAASLVAAVLTVSDASARPRGCCAKGMPDYDPATEVTLSGTVEEVLSMSGCGKARTGTHVTLRAGEDVLEVALGPSDFLGDNGIEIAKGDALEVTGSKVQRHGGDLVLARAVRLGERSLTLRDAEGVPAWSRGRRRG